MRIVQPFAKIYSPAILTEEDGIDLLRRVELIARVSHLSEDNFTQDSWRKFISANVLGHGDWSVTEHVSITAEFLVDRGITHELVRHRIAAITQQSTRFVNHAKKMPPTFIYPDPTVSCEFCLNGKEVSPYGENLQHSWHDDCSYDQDWLWAMRCAELRYMDLIAKGWSPDMARSVLPNGLSSRIFLTYNLRTWRHVFLMRTSKEAHRSMRQVMVPLLAEFKRLIPLLYEDIEPESRQIDNMKKPK